MEILGRRQQYKLVMSSCKMSDILARFYSGLDFIDNFRQSSQYEFHEFLPMGAALIHAQEMDRQAGRQMGVTKIIGTF